MGPRPGREHVHDLLGRLPDRRPVEPRPSCCATRVSTPRPGQLELDVRRGRFNFESSTRPSVSPSRSCAARAVSQATSWDRSWGTRMARCEALDGGGGDDRRARRRPWHQRGRLRLGAARRRARVAHRDAQLGDGLPAEVLGLPRATIDEAANAATVVLLGPDLKEELPVLYLRLRHAAEEADPLIEFIAPSTGLTGTRGARCGPSRARWRRSSSARSPMPTSAAQLGAGEVVVVAGGSTWPSPRRRPAASLRAVLDAVPGARVLPALRRGNVVGALQLGLRTADAGARRHRAMLGRRRRRSSCSCCSGPTRSTTAPTPTLAAGRWPASPPVGRHVPHASTAGRSRAAAAASVSRTARRPTSRVA